MIINLLALLVFLPQLRANCFPRSSRLFSEALLLGGLFFFSTKLRPLLAKARVENDDRQSPEFKLVDIALVRSARQTSIPTDLTFACYLNAPSMRRFYEVSKSVLDNFNSVTRCVTIIHVLF